MDSVLSQCERNKTQEFICKFSILKLYADLDMVKDYTHSLHNIDLKDLLYKKERFTAAKATMNGDSLYFLSLDLIKACHHQKEDVMFFLYTQLNEHAAKLDKYLEFHLFHAIYASLTVGDTKRLSLCQSLLKEANKNINYDKNILAIYQNSALLIKKYLNQPLSEKELYSLQQFTKTHLGSMIASDLS